MCRRIPPSLSPPAGYLPLHAPCREQLGRNLPESHHLPLKPSGTATVQEKKKNITGKTSKNLRIDFWQWSHLYSALYLVD